MHLDVRIPLGLLFVTLGIILGAYGLLAPVESAARSTSAGNVNLQWGIIFALFGGIVLFIARRKKS
jgi:hypothetical protein